MKPMLKSKRWDPFLEKSLFKLWTEEGIYRQKTGGKIWSIDTPPPYASGKWHMGGALHYSQIDMIARFKRMCGWNVVFPMGIDRNGLPVEVQAEKEYGVAMHETPREKFISLCREMLDKYEEEILEICRLLGLSMNDLENPYRTDSDKYRARTQETFIDLWKKGLVYEDSKPTNWCTVCGTSIADAEIEYKEKPTLLSTFPFKLKKGGELLIATTRPELLCACGVVMVHPDDERYENAVGKTAVVPIFEREVEVIAHPAAKMEFGTGVMMVCSYGDYTDVRLFRELGLEPKFAIGPDGKMTEEAGEYEGLTVEEAREAILKDLEPIIVKQETTEHRTPVCWRSKTPIEFVAMPEFYLKQVDFVDEIRKIADKIEFHPPHSKQILLDWLDSISIDWPISRRRYYGTEIPLWYCDECDHVFVPEGGEHYRPWKEVRECPECGGKMRGEERTFDTWMDSSISELEACGYGEDWFEDAFPCSVRPQGKDIVRTWLYYTLLRAYLLFEEPAFRHVWISGHVVDEHGEKMSKSVGNVVDPEPMIKKYGADAVRFAGTAEATLGSDIRFSEERLAGHAKFIQKLYNVARFVSMFEEAERPGTLEKSDEWILSELNEVIGEAREGYEGMDFFRPATSVRNFVWELFAPHYLELVKERAYEKEKSARYALHQCLRGVLEMLAPICPFVTDHIYREIYGESVHVREFPEKGEESLEAPIADFNRTVWKKKKKKGVSLRGEIEMEIPAGLSDFADDLKAMHHLKG